MNPFIWDTVSPPLLNNDNSQLNYSRFHSHWRMSGQLTVLRRVCQPAEAGLREWTDHIGTASVVREVGYKGLWQDIVKNSATAVLRWFKRFWCLPENNNWIKLIHLYRITNLKYKYLWRKFLSYLGNYWSARICRGRIFDELNLMDHFSHGDYMTGKKPVVP